MLMLETLAGLTIFAPLLVVVWIIVVDVAEAM
jgi:hypothetical protein